MSTLDLVPSVGVIVSQKEFLAAAVGGLQAGDEECGQFHSVHS